MKRKIIISLFLYLIVACTPYDSNKANTQMLQGEWSLYDMYYVSSDSTFISEYNPTDSIVLLFDGNSYKERTPIGENDEKLRFNVIDYRIIFHQDSSIYDWTNIEVLSADSLILTKANRIWKYKKVK